ncbi:MAG: histidine phosphatase family protein, partial [Lachnospiraceae bacterium]|nr:histidine phosphatase family protein [Lachnospiraceae bacterium]
ENQVTLAVIRHGETQANKEHRYLGKTDEPLNKNGMEALLSYQKRKLYPVVDCLFTSPMKRCIETAGVLYPKLCPVVIPEWEEMDFGQFEYKNYEELKEDARYQAWIDSGGILAFPEGESRENFILRCKEGLLRMCGELRKMTELETSVPLRVGMVVHGGTVMALLSSYSKKSYFDYQVSNGRGYLCRMENWYGETKSDKNNLQIEVVREI